MGCRWKFAAIQLLRKFHGSVHVFCRPDRSADYSRVVGFRHGKRPCACVTAGRPVAVATEYVGYSRCYGDKENHCLCSFGYHHGNNIGFCIRKFLLSFPFILLNRHEQKLLLVSVLCIQIIAFYFSNNSLKVYSPIG